MNFEYRFTKRSLHTPLYINQYHFESVETLEVSLHRNNVTGRGEASGVFYLGDDPQQMEAQLLSIQNQINTNLNRDNLQKLLPPGGARNALDCALWDLECKSRGESIWQKLQLPPKQLNTVFTIGISDASTMATQALEASQFQQLKIKLDQQDPIGKLSAIHQARPDAEMILDINQGWSEAQLLEYLPQLAPLGVVLLEQPLARGEDALLASLKRDIPIAADESCLDLADYHEIKSRYDVINIKLDKCGGLSEGLAIARQAKTDGKQLMVGNMIGSSLAMAPGYVIGQYCRFIDLDGPLLLTEDYPNPINISGNGQCTLPEQSLWG
ncbi:dipeptide epimerase [Pseudoteredinibacter isoporae]|uniref:Dipeptide epimerase n=1 Tax=Pseudoteredinibacter isoporae TaxID=570281 RepID=A0A7X0MVP6_9GAMM|nr:dipeptide epimerase [Pseudoteredinibacter isoporae]MBB6521340.1 L-alanine-DL-glutamate epimerase-like enolase superfamily enzyme [Pseudoteredinibacter isoporae]NHO86895.1 dipeptide epimerase [Pseudoteredinibacter isoporae]NIB24653.1 dipeptide epimerase [Pseudoteredinibacter isoporae]